MKPISIFSTHEFDFAFLHLAAYAAAPVAEIAAVIPGLIEKLSNFSIPTIPREIISAVRVEPTISFMRRDLKCSLFRSPSIIILNPPISEVFLKVDPECRMK